MSKKISAGHDGDRFRNYELAKLHARVASLEYQNHMLLELLQKLVVSGGAATRTVPSRSKTGSVAAPASKPPRGPREVPDDGSEAKMPGQWEEVRVASPAAAESQYSGITFTRDDWENQDEMMYYGGEEDEAEEYGYFDDDGEFHYYEEEEEDDGDVLDDDALVDTYKKATQGKYW